MGEEYNEQCDWICRYYRRDVYDVYPKCYGNSDDMVPS
jgi:hypothetical protein